MILFNNIIITPPCFMLMFYGFNDNYILIKDQNEIFMNNSRCKSLATNLKIQRHFKIIITLFFIYRMIWNKCNFFILAIIFLYVSSHHMTLQFFFSLLLFSSMICNLIAIILKRVSLRYSAMHVITWMGPIMLCHIRNLLFLPCINHM